MNAMPVLAAAAVLMAAACAATAPARDAGSADDAAASDDCAAIARRIERSGAAERGALNNQSGAWKAIVPMAVAAGYATAKAAVEDARRDTAELQAHAARLGCPAR